MNRHFPSLWTALVFGLIWSLAWSLALTLVPVGIAGQQAYGAALALSGAALAILTALRQNFRWTSILFAFILLLLFGAASVATAVRIIGSAAVLGWVRTAGRPQNRRILPLVAELIAAAGILCLAVGFYPTSAIVIGLGVWLFYLLQLIPLAAVDSTDWTASRESHHRRFETTRQRVEKILAARI